MDDAGAVAVAEAPIADVSSEESEGQESTESTESTEQTKEKLDGRNQPDALKKRISELRRQADGIADPVQKAALLADAKALNDTVGKGRAYEQIYPTVREARETKSLVDSFGGRDGLLQTQQDMQRMQEVDKQLESGDPAAAEALWKEAPDGMVKLAPIIFSELERNNPLEYQKAVTSHAIRFFENGGFLNAIAELYKGLRAGDADSIHQTTKNMEAWFNERKQQTEQVKHIDPRVKELESKLNETQSQQKQREIDTAYNGVVAHAGPVIDKFLKPIVAKLGLTKEQYEDLKEDTWAHLQKTRNEDATYKTVAAAKQKQGMEAVSTYIKSETESRANDAARAMANRRYGHQLKNGAVASKPNPTATPLTPGVTRGKEPSAVEIDYSIKGIQVAKKSGFKDLGDMILAGKAPLKAGGIRQWR